MNGQTIKCSDCSCCGSYRKTRNSRTAFSCEHQDQRYIHDYFSNNNMKKMPGFIGYSKPYSADVPIKTSPAWCPRKKV